MKRLVVPELLDTDSGTPREVEDSLADLPLPEEMAPAVVTRSRPTLVRSFSRFDQDQQQQQ